MVIHPRSRSPVQRERLAAWALFAGPFVAFASWGRRFGSVLLPPQLPAGGFAQGLELAL
jgi:hypothetical protein